MNKKIMVLAIAAVSAAVLALPAIASAGVWDLEQEGGHCTALKPCKFTVHGGTQQLTTAGSTVHCTTVTGNGEYTDTTTGHLHLTFHGCTTEVFGAKVNCNNVSGQTNTITTKKLSIHNVLLEASPRTPGVLIKPVEASFASFTCFGVGVTVSGNGVIGQVTSPACGATSKTATISFTSKSTGVQTWSQVTTTGTVYGLKKGEESASQDGSATITFGTNGKLNCT